MRLAAFDVQDPSSRTPPRRWKRTSTRRSRRVPIELPNSPSLTVDPRSPAACTMSVTACRRGPTPATRRAAWARSTPRSAGRDRPDMVRAAARALGRAAGQAGDQPRGRRAAASGSAVRRPGPGRPYRRVRPLPHEQGPRRASAAPPPPGSAAASRCPGRSIRDRDPGAQRLARGPVPRRDRRGALGRRPRAADPRC